MKKYLLILLALLSFQVQGQTVCDSLDILLVNVNAFINNQMNIRVQNTNTQEIFDYPGFRVYDESDNLIGEEEVFFFGIGGESTHAVTFNENDFSFVMGQNYTLRLELWKNFYSEMVCEFEVSYVVIPQIIDCVDIELNFTEFSQEEVIYEILLSDYSGNPIHNEILVYSPSVASITRNFCVPPSCYYVMVTSEQASEASSVYMSSIALDVYGFDNVQILDQQIENTIVFSIWTDCALINSVKGPFALETLKVYPNPVIDLLYVEHEEDTAAEWEIFNSVGKSIMRTENAYAPIQTIDVSHLSSGLYFIRAKQNRSIYSGSFIKN